MQPRPDPASLTDLRRHLAEMALRGAPAAVGQVSFGAPALDEALGGGIARAALHEVYAPATADLAAATGFAVGLAIGPRRSARSFGCGRMSSMPRPAGCIRRG